MSPRDREREADSVMIQVEGLVKCFASLRAVDDVSFTIRRGEVVGFLGPNGAGKSTTMRILTGFLEADQGSVRIEGELLGPGSAGMAARAHIGYLPERAPLDRAMRVDRYLAFVAALRGLRGAALRAALERVVASCDLAGYTARRIETLSKGYRQRVGLAQALVADPDVLILDEPTSGLDPAEIVRVRQLITSLARDKTILLSTHVLGEIEEVCPRALMIAAGRIVADGSLEELARERGQRLLLRVVEPTPALISALLELEQVQSCARAEEHTLHLVVRDCELGAPAVAACVERQGARLLELRPDQPTLEKLFLERTRGLERSFERRARSVGESA